MALVLAACGAPGPDGSPPRDLNTGTYLVLLGTGTPNADPDRWGPALAVLVDGTAYLVDAGPGVVRRAAGAAANGADGLRAERLATVFITHLHHDHTLGLADLIFSPWTLGREEPLRVYGPPGTAAMVDHLQAAYAEDVRIRLDGLEPANRTGHEATVHDIADTGEVYADARVRVTAFPVHHGSWPHAFGYRFESPERTIVVSGDATKSETVVTYCNSCDVLVHEVYSEAGFATRPPEWQAYHARFHTSSVDLADLATRARPALLVLYHQLLWGQPEAVLMSEIKSRYDGPVVFGRDLEVY